ncbi:MAG: UDP-N-acetylenolpyruvoylglucosamine reductase [Methyloligella sp.]|jgi:UDP-N-acetylmuramate dehydrogenase|nr:MAG: UDP-N-acetylenolpyruvoylglucosamine reductase [Methyloligella sp.]
MGSVGFEDHLESFQEAMPELRGRLKANSLMSEITWFRVGGPAQLLFTPADEADLAYFMKNKPVDLPITIIGLGSNLLVRDGGIPGIVVRLGRGFNAIEALDDNRIKVGTAVPDMKLARAAAEHGVAGLSFYRGIPGSIGGALRMNAGAHGGETRDYLQEARAVDYEGNIHTFTAEEMGHTYRNCALPNHFIFTEAVFKGQPGSREEIEKANAEVVAYREEKQPVKDRTGGSTFKNPPGHSSWKLIDEAGLRGFKVGGAKVSEKHCNFLINEGDATGTDIETLGETVRKRVFEKSGVKLDWEIKRLGVADVMGEDLAQ